MHRVPNCWQKELEIIAVFVRLYFFFFFHFFFKEKNEWTPLWELTRVNISIYSRSQKELKSLNFQSRMNMTQIS